jgi:hypothetical protein
MKTIPVLDLSDIYYEETVTGEDFISLVQKWYKDNVGVDYMQTTIDIIKNWEISKRERFIFWEAIDRQISELGGDKILHRGFRLNLFTGPTILESYRYVLRGINDELYIKQCYNGNLGKNVMYLMNSISIQVRLMYFEEQAMLLIRAVIPCRLNSQKAELQAKELSKKTGQPFFTVFASEDLCSRDYAMPFTTSLDPTEVAQCIIEVAKIVIPIISHIPDDMLRNKRNS